MKKGQSQACKRQKPPGGIELQGAGLRLLYGLVRPFFGCRCVNLPADTTEPVVLVCNHYCIFGPVAAAVSLPLRFRPWVHGDMLDSSRIVGHMRPSFSRLPDGLCRVTLSVVARPIAHLLNKLRPIPVRKEGGPRGLLLTMRQTAEAMAAGDSILLFPENGSRGFPNGGVAPLQEGFARIGSYYYRQTGREALFYPVYIDKRRRLCLFGTAVRYNAQNEPREKKRVATLLFEELLRLSHDKRPPSPTEETKSDERDVFSPAEGAR